MEIDGKTDGDYLFTEIEIPAEQVHTKKDGNDVETNLTTEGK